MSFETFKTRAMKGYTAAKKQGLVDKDIVKHLDKFNKLKNYYTTSSCSGRILLLRINENETKMPNAFYFKKHAKVTKSEIIKYVNKYKEKYDLWFKLDTFILHIGCKGIESARKLLALCKKLGIKRAGINAFSKRIIVEVIGTQAMNTIIVKNNKKVVTNDYLELLVNEANKKITRAKKRLYNFFKQSESNI